MRELILLLTLSIVLSSCSSEPNNIKINSLHSDLSFREADKKGYVVAGPSGLSNVDKIEKFFEDYQNKNSNSITLAQYTDEGDPIYVDLEYNGEEISYTYDNTWDGFGGQNKGVRTTSCAHMGKRIGPRGDRFGTEYYLTSCKKDVGYSDIQNKEYFLLFIYDDEKKIE